MFFSSIFVSIVPAFIFLIFIWWLDRYDREPWYLVLGAFAWGALGAIVIAIMASLTLAAPFKSLLDAKMVFGITVVVIAPIVEEIAKAVILIPLALHRKFDGFIDGMVYGSMVGLGFAVTENFFYYLGVFLNKGAFHWAITVVIRTFCSTFIHALSTGVAGAAIGYCKFTKQRFKRYYIPLLGLFIAMFIHSFYNGAITYAQFKGVPGVFLIDIVVLVLELFLAFVVMQVALYRESVVLEEELSEECERGLLKQDDVDVVPSYWRRLSSLWSSGASKYWKRQKFFALATDLALRKREARLSEGEERDALLADAEAIRKEIVELDGEISD